MMMQKENTSLAIYNQYAPADIMMTEYMYRLEVLQEYIVEKRGHKLSGTLLTGMKVELRPLRAKRREAVQRPAIPEG